MADPAIGWIAVVSGAAGLFLSHVGSLVPSRKDFMAQVLLKKQACIEKLASAHYHLMKEFGGVEDFDNIARGDGINERDYFGEYAQCVLISSDRRQQLLVLARWFGRLHSLLVLVVISLIVGGALLALGVLWLNKWVMFGLLGLEGLALLGLYFAGVRLEQVE